MGTIALICLYNANKKNKFIMALNIKNDTIY